MLNISFLHRRHSQILYICSRLHSNHATNIRDNFQLSKFYDDYFQLMGTILTRIQEICTKEGISIGAMEKSVGASKGVLSRAISNGTDIQSKWIQRIVENYPIYSADWLLSGRGIMLKSKIESGLISNISKGKPYYDVDFIAGFDEIINSQVSIPTANIIIQGFEKADLWCNVSGHSMEPKISHGDIIALRKCTIEDVQYGEIYAVVLDTIRTIKILRKSKDPNKLRFIPINIENYDEKEYPISRILHIYEVIGSISKFF